MDVGEGKQYTLKQDDSLLVPKGSRYSLVHAIIDRFSVTVSLLLVSD